MVNLKSIFNLLAISLMASACINIDGQLDVKQVMTAKMKSGFLHLKTKDVQIQPSIYRADLKINGDKSFTLKLEGRDKISLPIKSSKDFNVPSNGKFTISNSDINQPFDINGIIATDIKNSSRYNQVEDCTWTVRENHCKKVCSSSTSCHAECADVEVVIHGRREVEYHFRTIHRDLSIDLLSAGKSEVLASFQGSSDDTDKINDYIGACN